MAEDAPQKASLIFRAEWGHPFSHGESLSGKGAVLTLGSAASINQTYGNFSVMLLTAVELTQIPLWK